MTQGVRCPGCSLIGMARSAWVGNFIFFRHARRDEAKGVGVDFDVRDRSLNLRHVACNALASGAAGFVMSVLFECCGTRSAWGQRTVAIQTDFVRWFSQQRVVAGAMRVVTTKAGDAATIHHALHEVVPLHPILVAGAVGEVREAG